MKVLKFGGTSVGSTDSIRQVANILKKRRKKNLIVVVSALGGVTNQLIEAGQKAAAGKNKYLDIFEKIQERHIEAIKELIEPANQVNILTQAKVLFNNLEDLLHGIYLIREISPRSMDMVQSFGERLSAMILSTYLNQEKTRSRYVDARTVIKTDSTFGSARVNYRTTNRKIRKSLSGLNEIPIVTGFIASTEENVTSTLGRGGSDYTAAIVAAALAADEIEIWTDVDGVMTADPRKVPDAFSLENLSYNEAMEMSYFGAKVIYPPTLQPAINKKIPLRILNTFNPEFPGTVIRARSTFKKHPVKGISSIENIALISLIGSGMVGVPGISSRLFGALADAGVNVILISQASSEHSICFAVAPVQVKEAKNAIEEAFAWELDRKKIERITIEDDLSIVAVVGENMKNTPGISAKLFGAMGHNGINVSAIAQGSSELNISIVIPSRDMVKALNALHQYFFLSDIRKINLFLVGTGLIGSTLLSQIKKQAAYLSRELLLEIRVTGIANSRNTHFDPSGIEIDQWKKLIDKPGKGFELKKYVQRMKEMNLNNSVFVDCTSSAEVIRHYREILDASISIVTPNKIANSIKMDTYQELKDTAFGRGVKFLYETNVGAGLPVISTLKDLKYSGDQVISIEGVLSGTLSYIFNTFDGSEPFSKVVKNAQDKGYTEPDPRDDLSGEDVARKILILAREAGFSLEPDDVNVEPFLPTKCFKVKSVKQFYTEMEKADDTMAKMISQAGEKGQSLRYVATLREGKANVKLTAVDASHPFYNLSGSDNVISFTTERYRERPLVIKGPGAGAEVTAAGVFAEVISVGNYLAAN